jgi:hypothetical protein
MELAQPNTTLGLPQETRGIASMKFTVPDLKSLSGAVRSLSARERAALSAMIRRRQPDFCEIIDEVGMDPRCAPAHRFCTVFCALALKHAEEAVLLRLPRFQGDDFEEVCGFMARGDTQIGRMASGYPKRILRHVLSRMHFDGDDTAWLCTTISAFLFLVEKSAEERRLQEG